MIKLLNTQSFGQLPVRLSYYALKMFQAETGRSFMFGNSDELKFEDFEILLFYSVEKGCKANGRPFTHVGTNGQEVPFTRDDMVDVLDECLMDFISMIPEFFPKKKTENEQTQKNIC